MSLRSSISVFTRHFLTCTHPITNAFRRLLFVLLVLLSPAWADGSSINVTAPVQEKLKLMLDPIRGLNSEIKSGLQKIEQTCAIISKAKLAEAKQALANAPEAKQQSLKIELLSARQLAFDQSQTVQSKVGGSRAKLEAMSKSCDASKSLQSDACKQYMVSNEKLSKVSDAASYYYTEALARLSSYEQANELENNGCTRPGFAYRLWSAEQAHLLPTLKNSAQTFSDLLN